MSASSRNPDPASKTWESDAPYKTPIQNPPFAAKYTGHCHCRRIEYQISRDAPLDAKFCHCRTCQAIHGIWSAPSKHFISPRHSYDTASKSYHHRSTISMGSYFSQRWHQVLARCHRAAILQQRKDGRRAHLTLQSLVRTLRIADYGWGTEYDIGVSRINRSEDWGWESEVRCKVSSVCLICLCLVFGLLRVSLVWIFWSKNWIGNRKLIDAGQVSYVLRWSSCRYFGWAAEVGWHAWEEWAVKMTR